MSSMKRQAQIPYLITIENQIITIKINQIVERLGDNSMVLKLSNQRARVSYHTKSKIKNQNPNFSDKLLGPKLRQRMLGMCTP